MGTNAEVAPESSLLTRVLIGRHPKRTLVRIVVLVVVCFSLRAFVLLPIKIEGISMLPTCKDGSIHIVNRVAFLFRKPQRGDVVAIRMLAGGHVMYLKRIIGLPGEQVSFHKGQLYINDQLVPEPYLSLPCDWEHEAEEVPSDRYYVVGDNRTMSWQDHDKGRPTRDLIVGKLLL